MWKFLDFRITQILREIKFGNSRSAKSATFTHSKALNSDFYEFFYFQRLKFTKLTKFRAPKMAKMAKMAVFELLDSPKLISRKIWVVEKPWNFHIMYVFCLFRKNIDAISIQSIIEFVHGFAHCMRLGRDWTSFLVLYPKAAQTSSSSSWFGTVLNGIPLTSPSP